jgi:hypothetical protein
MKITLKIQLTFKFEWESQEKSEIPEILNNKLLSGENSSSFLKPPPTKNMLAMKMKIIILDKNKKVIKSGFRET